jgi:hypothetical protein
MLIHLKGKNKYKILFNKKYQLHNENGPSCEFGRPTSVYEEWYINGLQHREDGPAVLYKGRGLYYIKNNWIEKKEDYYYIIKHNETYYEEI